MEQNVTAETLTGGGTDVSQYLTFSLGAEEYGLEILKVQEIKGYTAITPIPNTPPHVKGVMNLRGTVVPVVDLRAKFALSAVEYTKFTVIIIVTVADKTTGLIVDSVSDVLEIPASQIRPAPNLGTRADTRFISGMAEVADKLTVLLDLDRLLSDEEAAALEGICR
jgi:purine-binding chemotaxis protein CheW